MAIFGEFWALVRRCRQFPGGCETADGFVLYAYSKDGKSFYLWSARWP